jgi:hypothetical protein
MGQFCFYLLLLANSGADADPGSDAFLNPASVIRDRKKSGSGIQDKIFLIIFSFSA